MKKYFLFAAVAVLVVAGGIGLWRFPIGRNQIHLAEAPMTTQDLTTQADVIVRGVITHPTTFIDRNGEQPVVRTIWTISSPSILKGDPKSPLTFVVPGGKKVLYTSEVYGAPNLQAQDAVLVFLKWVPEVSQYIPLSVSQGVLKGSGHSFRAENGTTVSDQAVQSAMATQ